MICHLPIVRFTSDRGVRVTHHPIKGSSRNDEPRVAVPVNVIQPLPERPSGSVDTGGVEPPRRGILLTPAA